MHDLAEKLLQDSTGKDFNEADTRHQIIDPLLHEVLAWPRNRTLCEDFIRPGFADYVLVRSDKAPIVLIEAKRTGVYFALPQDLLGDGYASYIKVKTLLTDESVSAAMIQVRDYCLNKGCEFAAVTNGQQWIFFKTFQISQDWRELRAFVIYNLKYFSLKYVDAANHLSYAAITERGSLRRMFCRASRQLGQNASAKKGDFRRLDRPQQIAAG